MRASETTIRPHRRRQSERTIVIDNKIPFLNHFKIRATLYQYRGNV